MKIDTWEDSQSYLAQNWDYADYTIGCSDDEFDEDCQKSR